MKLEDLYISNCFLYNSGLRHISYLANLNSLRSMSLRDGMTSEGFDYLCNLKNLKSIFLDCGINNNSFVDINLSPNFIEMLINISSFECSRQILKPEVEITKGFHYVIQLRNSK